MKNIYFKLIAISLTFCKVGFSQSEMWLCKEEASQRQGNSIYSCGVGISADENEARSRAFENARAEFSRVCDASDDCKNHEITIQPARTSCGQEVAKYKCYRLIVFSIGASKAKVIRHNSGDIAYSAPQLNDKPDAFQPFVYESIQNNPKVRVGMTKKELLAVFGAPESVSDWSAVYGNGQTLHLTYQGRMCQDSVIPCFVSVHNGRVKDYSEFKPIYTEDLKSDAVVVRRTVRGTKRLPASVGPKVESNAPPPGMVEFLVEQCANDDSKECEPFRRKK